MKTPPASLLTRSMIPAIFAILLSGAGTALAFNGGDGSLENPYQVATAAHLDDVRNHLDAHFLQIADINLGVAPWNEAAGWFPIGTSANRFTGSYDGGGFAIFNLTIQRPSIDYQGLFGALGTAEVRNLSLPGAQVTGRGYVGALTGHALNSKLDNVSVTGTVSGPPSAYSYVGGLAGVLSGGSAHRGAVNAEVLGNNVVGGLIGYLTNHAEIRASYALGTVQGNNDVGGLVGQMYNGSQTIADSFSMANVTGASRVGGLVGYIWSGNVYRCYSAGAVSGPDGVSTIGGLTGAGANAHDSFWDTEASGQPASAGGTGLTTAEMHQRASFRYFNFNTLWTIAEGAGYPVFRNLSGHSQPVAVALGSLAGSGTEGDPYLLTTADELNAMRLDLAAHYRLGNDIDLAATVVWDAGKGWDPVGTSSSGQRFTGSFDGAGHTISNLSINRPITNYQGLFGYAHDAVVRNVKVIAANVQAGAYMGVLAGTALSSRIESVSVDGVLVLRGSSIAGGLAGTINGGAVHDAAADVVIKGGSYVGGLVGYLTNHGEIRNSHSRGLVEGNADIGGLVGNSYSGTPLITDSYSMAAVSGASRVGGLVGYLWTGNIYRAYSAGPVAGPDGVTTIGGLTGSGSSAFDSYWDIEASGQETSAGGEGLTSVEMRQQSSFVGFNFNTLWAIDEDVTYPYFQDLSHHDLPVPVELAGLSGLGTETDPYILTTPDELNAMRQDPAAHYRLGDDIDLAATIVWDSGRGWLPIGSSAVGQQFTGGFDGAGFTISNLSVNRPYTMYQGLFAYANGATIRNVRITGANLQSRTYVGILVGSSHSSRLEFIQVDGVSVSRSTHAGGLAGQVVGGAVHHAAADVTVKASSHVGGLVGYLTNHGEIRNSYSQGSVLGGDDAGGLVGRLYSGTQFITDSYSLASVSGASRVGGLVGYVWTGNVYRSYSAGPVAGSASVGGLIGQGTNAHDSYWDNQTSGQETSAAGEGLSAAEMRQRASFVCFNFNTLWTIDEGHSYPVFKDISHYDAPRAVDISELAGSGTETDPYILTTSDELNAMRQDLAAHYRLGNDIDLAATVIWDSGRGWLPVGTSTTNQQFTGSIDGAGFTVSNLTSNRPISNYQGLFGYANNATLKNVRIVGANLHSAAYVGILIGSSHYSAIESVAVEGVLVTRNSHAGGLAGQIVGGSARFIAADVEAKGPFMVGGIAGYLTAGGQIHSSYSLGDVRGNTDIGGLVGRLYSGSQFIADSYSMASVSGNGQVGGLVGYLWTGNVYRCYSTGAVSGPDGVSTIGGLTGSGATAHDSFWNTETSGQATSAGGVGRTTAEMTYPHAGNTYLAWDFATVWSADVSTRNHGYPYLTGHSPAFFIILAAAPAGSGIVAGEGLHSAGEAVVIEANANEGYHFLYWQESGTIVSTSSAHSFTATADRELTAHFARNQYTLAYHAAPGGTLTGNTSQLVEHGADGQAVTAVPDEGYSFLQWSDGVTTATRQEIAVTGPAEATAQFEINRYTLTYHAGPGGDLVGPSPQTVEHGGHGTTMFAQAVPGAVFLVWSDGSTANPRAEMNVTGDLTVTAGFTSLGGVPIDWYVQHGLAPDEGETWGDLDGKDRFGKGMTLRDEYIANTDPNDPQSRFVTDAPVRVGTAMEIHFQPSSPDRRYTLWMSTDLAGWLPVPGQINVPGGNGPLTDFEPPIPSAFYRIEVSLP